jgi:hypothetical protein
VIPTGEEAIDAVADAVADRRAGASDARLGELAMPTRRFAGGDIAIVASVIEIFVRVAAVEGARRRISIRDRE